MRTTDAAAASAGSRRPPTSPVVGGIWARTPDGVIGRDGTIPWYVPEDLKFFSAVTTGHPVIMGRRTWDSFPDRFRPLPRRANIVITSRPESVPADEQAVWTAASYGQALEIALGLQETQEPDARIWAIGGTRVWREALEHPGLPMSLAYVTTVDLDVAGDTRAPELTAGWSRTQKRDWQTSSGGPRFRVDRYTRAFS